MAIMKPCGFMAMMKETIKLLSQNGKLMAFIAILHLFLYSLFFLLNTFSTKSLIYDLVLKMMDIASASPGTPQFANLLVSIKEDVGAFLGVELAFILIYFFISLFSKTSIIFISASSYSGDTLTVKELILRVAKSWTRPFVTGFYVTLLGLGYTTLFILPFVIPSLVFLDHHPMACISILAVLALVVIVFYIYLSVVWVLGLVISVLEESRGLEALGKARELVKGMRLQGFILNVVINILLLILSQVPQMIRFKQSAAKPIITGLIQLFFICLVSFFQYMAYTVLYFQCKKKHGEEIKLHGSMEYSEVPTKEEIV